MVIICAAKVGGILKNINYPADFYLDNILIQNNLIKSCHENNVKNLIFLQLMYLSKKIPCNL